MYESYCYLFNCSYIGSVSLFFVTGVWDDYISEATGIAIDEVPIKGHPTVSIRFGHPYPKDDSRPVFKLGHDFDLHYYRTNLMDGKIYHEKLGLGDADLGNGEIVHLREMRNAYSVMLKTNKCMNYLEMLSNR